ncbi:hypothetical protein [Marinobacter halophilus]|uniref:Uncharacterized protein n=1 Tax=Marinobacter halophilus TaxID=1323740 RepID=A0A2T1KCD6_9GAMM|nr:hypothetical protein [Marinobacter halophilus]PSF07787.1 hypothetical protein C7H08_10270 [Marinobacter halophilus]
MTISEIKSTLSKSFPGSRQKGASSLEYLMLGAVIVIILGVVITQGDTIGGMIVGVFESLMGEAQVTPDGAGG